MNRPPRIWIADANERPTQAAPLYNLTGYEWLNHPLTPGCPPDDIDLVIATDERALPAIIPLFRACRERAIPTLHVIDGIIDWRNCFANPTHDLPGAPAPSLFRPVVADKLACLGVMQCLLVEHFGNVGRAELTGSLRLDEFAGRMPAAPAPTPHQHLLITTARTPAFTAAQRRALVALLAELREWLASRPRTIDGIDISATWRIPPDLATELALSTQQTDVTGPEFHAALAKAHVLVTTSSTTLLEGMIATRPTVLLDYSSTPAFVETAWVLRQGVDFSAVLSDALNGTPTKLMHQNFLRNLNVLVGEARHRTHTLIDTMVDAGRRARRERTPLTLAERILPWPGFGVSAKAIATEESFGWRAEVMQHRRQRHYDQQTIAYLSRSWRCIIRSALKRMIAPRRRRS